MKTNIGLLALLGLGALLVLNARKNKGANQGLQVKANIRTLSVDFAAHKVSKARGSNIKITAEWNAGATQGGAAVKWDYRLHFALGKVKKLGGVEYFIPILASSTSYPNKPDVATISAVLGTTAVVSVSSVSDDQTHSAEWTIENDWPIDIYMAMVVITARNASGTPPKTSWPFDQTWPIVAALSHPEAASITAGAVNVSASISSIAVAQGGASWQPVLLPGGRLGFVPTGHRRWGRRR